jgi:hypothetical protein
VSAFIVEMSGELFMIVLTRAIGTIVCGGALLVEWPFLVE